MDVRFLPSQGGMKVKTVHYNEAENGALIIAEDGEKMDILCPITQQEFEDRFPETSTYGLEWYSTVFLENGVILIDKEWNGEEYHSNVNGKHYKPVYKEEDGEFETVGYYESNY